MKTVTVRIPVAVYADGTGWISGPCGSQMQDPQKRIFLADELNRMDSEKILFVLWITSEFTTSEPIDAEVNAVLAYMEKMSRRVNPPVRCGDAEVSERKE